MVVAAWCCGDDLLQQNKIKAEKDLILRQVEIIKSSDVNTFLQNVANKSTF